MGRSHAIQLLKGLRVVEDAIQLQAQSSVQTKRAVAVKLLAKHFCVSQTRREIDRLAPG